MDVPDTKKNPDVVYHYTSMSTLLKIIEERELWATSVNYLNDVSENRLFIAAATQHLPEFAKDHEGVDMGPFYRHEVDENEQATSFEKLPFVTSLSREGDSLTHWRSYCNDGNGVSIGFKCACLTNASVREPDKAEAGMLIPRPVFGRVEYLNPADPEAMRTALQESYDYALHSYDTHGLLHRLGMTLGTEFFTSVQNIASFYKDQSFRDEREYRLLVSDLNYRRDLIKYRTSRSTLVPYVPLVIPNLDGQINKKMAWDAIATITVGPTPNMNLTLDSLRVKTEYCGMKLDVLPSKVAYRDW